jgi:hypothetical protein
MSQLPTDYFSPPLLTERHKAGYALAVSLCLGLFLISSLAQPVWAKKSVIEPVTKEEEAIQTPAFHEDVPHHDDGLESNNLLNTAPKFKEASEGTRADHSKPKSAQAKKAPEGKKKAAAPAEPKPSYQMDEGKLTTQTRQDIERLTKALNEQSQTVFNELKDDQELASKDIAMLWQAAVERSGTIRYAIEKLSRKDATGKPVSNDGLTKRLLQSAARVGGVAGSMWTGTPAGILGGNMVEQLMATSPTDPSQMRITDADMLILAKEVDALQSQVIETYYQYRQAEERWEIAQEAATTLEKQYEKHQHSKSRRSSTDQALKPLMDSMIQTAEQEENNHKQAFVNARNALGLLVGGDALLALEQARQQESTSSSALP